MPICQHDFKTCATKQHKTPSTRSFIALSSMCFQPTTINCRRLANNFGLVHTKQRARLTVYWPGIDNDIENVITTCQLCQDHLPSNPKEPIVSKPKPLCPFQEVAVDFCTYGGKQFLIIVNCYTDWPDIIPMGTNTTTHHLTIALRSIFCRTAIPDILWSDGGPQFTAKAFQIFATQWDFTH